MLRTIKVALVVFFELLKRYPAQRRLLKLFEKDKFAAYKEANKEASNLGIKVLKSTGASVKVYGEENIPEENCVFMANHQSYFDIVAFMALNKKDKTFLYKDGIGKVPLLRGWLKVLDGSKIDRKSARNSMAEVLKAIENVKNGYSVVIFPEGTRSKSDNMIDFKDGAFKIATKPKVKVVPVVLDNMHAIFESNGGVIKPAKCSMTYLKPIDTCNLSKEELKELPLKVHDLIESNLKIKIKERLESENKLT